MSATVNFIPNVDLSQPFNSKLMILNDIEGCENGIILHKAGADGPPIHTHPVQEEYFTIIKGELEVYKNKKWNVIKAGESIHIPVNTSHSYRSRSKVDCLFSYKITPNGGFSDMMRYYEKLSKQGKITSLSDFRSLVHLAMAFKKFSHDVKSTSPPDFVMTAMAYLGKILRYKI